MEASGSVLDRFPLSLEVIIRPCREDDLPGLEWFGLFTPHRELIARVWRRHLAGDNVMLVAESRRFPIGQVWIDLTKRAPEPVGLLWALRVFPFFQGMGLGSRLIAAAERVLRERGVPLAELGAEKNNPGARHLYERLGYRVVGDMVEEYGYTTPEGQAVRATVDEWVLRKVLVGG